MKALTLWQPWASLVVAGAKPYEFRGWRPPRSIIGQRIVIHAAARRINRDEVADLIERLRAGGEAAAETCLHPELALPVLELAARPTFNCGVPFACGVGTAVLGEPRNGVDIAREFGVTSVNDSDRDEHANWGWPMLDIERWPDPVGMRGAQGFWNWPTPEATLL